MNDWQHFLQQFLRFKNRSPLLVIVGPTAVGKTEFSIRLARRLQSEGRNAEIINADSRQLYRTLDIGTAKITPAEMDGVPHHLLSVLDPHEECTIAWFQAQATNAIAAIHRRGNIPILVGGSMLYVRSLIDGFQPLPPSDPALRRRLEEEYDKDHGKSLFQRLHDVDPETAASFPMQNKVYVVRAMEIYESTGIPKSRQRSAVGSSYDLLILGLERPKADLHARIHERTKKMLSSGWLDEVEGLRRSGCTAETPAMKSHGYREILEYLEEGRKKTMDELSETISSNVRKYAKRHMTWWKKDGRIHWITLF